MSKESVYDSEIAPLMERVLKICKDNKIATVADFALDEDLHCTSALLTDEFEPSPGQLDALAALRLERAFSMAETIETKPDGSKRITLRRIS